MGGGVWLNVFPTLKKLKRKGAQPRPRDNQKGGQKKNFVAKQSPKETTGKNRLKVLLEKD